jgi:hypothetical protein
LGVRVYWARLGSHPTVLGSPGMGPQRPRAGSTVCTAMEPLEAGLPAHWRGGIVGQRPAAARGQRSPVEGVGCKFKGVAPLSGMA